LNDEVTTSPQTARRLWHLFEPVHAVVYFAPEVGAAFKSAGLKGFWMGYFAGRSAPLGAASPELVTATFFGFHESMVRRSLPDAWSLASPDVVLDARRASTGAALRALLGDLDVSAAADRAREAAEHLSLAGRPLLAANATLPWPDDPYERLWHATTLLREHRGDGHVAANVAHGVGGLAAHVTLCATGAVPRESLQPSRGWSDEEWDGTVERLRAGGVVDDAGALTASGRALRQAIEDATDRAAVEPWLALGADRTQALHDLLTPLAAAIRSSGLIPFPNPMGLPAGD
jgi:hypothetical protein